VKRRKPPRGRRGSHSSDHQAGRAAITSHTAATEVEAATVSIAAGAPAGKPLIDAKGRYYSEFVLTTWPPAVIKVFGIRRADGSALQRTEEGE
jgi:hypothetical protein